MLFGVAMPTGGTCPPLGDQPGSRILVIERRFLMPGLYDGEMSRGVTRVLTAIS